MKLLAHSVHHQVLSVLGLLGVQRVNRFENVSRRSLRVYFSEESEISFKSQE